MKIKKLINLFIILGSIFTLIGCGSESGQTGTSSNQPAVIDSGNSNANPESQPADFQVDPPVVAPADSGKASVTGSIYSTTFNQPIVGIPVSLSEIIRDDSGEGVYVYDPAFSPSTESLPGGYFVIENVDPGEYVVVVGNVEINTYQIILEPNELPKIFEVPVDQVTDISSIEVEGLDIYINPPTNQDGYPAPDAYPEPESDS